MIKKQIRHHKSFYAFGISTLIIAFTMLCATALAALYLLTAYSSYKSVENKAEYIQTYYESNENNNEQ